MSNSLPLATTYRWMDKNLGRRFEARGRFVHLDTITDADIEQLLHDDPEYWGAKFKRRKSRRKEVAPDTTDEPTEQS